MAKSSNKSSFWPSMRENALFATVLLVILILLGTLFASLTLKTLIEVDNIGIADVQERTITVEGSSSAVAAPDEATISIGVESKAESVEVAQDQNSNDISRISSQIQAAGIPAEDIQTRAYNVYEDEVYNPETGEFVSQGWIVYQSLEVRVKNVELVSSVLDIAGRNGATDVYGPNYAVGDTGVQKETARAQAIIRAKTQAEMIASALGAKIGDVVTYEEWTSGEQYRPYAEPAVGLGGAGDAAVEPGTEELELNVSITFELVQ